MRFISYLIFLIISLATFASFIKGKVVDHHNNPLPGVTVKIQGTSIGDVTNTDGRFSIEVEKGKYTLDASYVGFQTITKNVVVPGKGNINVNFTLEESVSDLEEVVVLGKSDSQLKREEPIKVESIDVARIMEQSTSVPELINQTSGVKVRQ
ncbi:MAG: carboxypeptidase-like regulatory domain-containing protein, partial [Bacteroidota bacterium]